MDITYVGAFTETERLIHHAVTVEVESKDSQVNYLSDMLSFIWWDLFWSWCITWCISLPVLKIQFYKLFVTVFALYIHCRDAKNKSKNSKLALSPSVSEMSILSCLNQICHPIFIKSHWLTSHFQQQIACLFWPN